MFSPPCKGRTQSELRVLVSSLSLFGADPDAVDSDVVP